MDDLDILRELVRSVYITSRQRAALRRVIGALYAAKPLVFPTDMVRVTDGATEAITTPEVRPLLGPGDGQ